MTARPSALLSALVVAAAGPFLGATAAYADAPAPYNATINQGNVPATAAQYSQGCDEFAGKPADSDGWLFVASPSNFTDFEGIFDNGTVTLNGANPAGTSTFFAKADDHLAVITPAGWTLTQAYATLDGDRDFFTLSHTCAASQATPEAGGTGGDDQGGGGDDQGAGGGDQSGAGADSVGAGDGGGDQTGGGGDAVGPDTGVGGNEAGAGGPVEDVGTSGQSGQASGGGAVGQTPTRVLGERVTRSAAGASRAGTASQSGTTSAAGAGNLPFTGSAVADVAPAAGAVVLVGIALCWAGRRPRSRMQA